MRQLLVLVIASELLVAVACANSIRVATYNLNWGNRRGDQVLDAIKTANPDLICFQETTRQSERFLQTQLQDKYPHFHAIGHQDQFAAERFAFASRFELTNLKFHPPTDGLFGFCTIRFQLDEKTVHVVNVHLEPFRINRNDGFRKTMAALSVTEEVHQREIERILKSIDRQNPTIIVGDFISISKFVAPTRLRTAGLTDAFASIHADADSHPTWKWPTRPLPLAMRVDYIFHTDHFKATAAQVVRRLGSDHALLVATLKTN